MERLLQLIHALDTEEQSVIRWELTLTELRLAHGTFLGEESLRIPGATLRGEDRMTFTSICSYYPLNNHRRALQIFGLFRLSGFALAQVGMRIVASASAV
jgi:hypothetical protein